MGFLSKFSIFFNIFNIEKKSIKVIKSNGVFGQILNINNELKIILIKLPSGFFCFFNFFSFCCLGRNSNLKAKFISIGKAGYMKFFGKKPVVRGVAKNPVDHPHGGRTKTNKTEVSP